MLVCICKGITEKMIEDAQSKNKNLQDVFKFLGVGKDCGICLLKNSKTNSLKKSSK
jgi:bacterioferritin-associated ferredoxin